MPTAVQERSLGCARDDEAGERMDSQGWCVAFLEDGILVSQPSPRGEGAPKGRIGHRRHEREWEGASQVDDLRKHPIHRSAVPLPRWGRQIAGGFAAILRLMSQLFWHSLSHIRRFSPLRMTKRGKRYFQHNKKGYRLMSDSLFIGISISLCKERWKRSVP